MQVAKNLIFLIHSDLVEYFNKGINHNKGLHFQNFCIEFFNKDFVVNSIHNVNNNVIKEISNSNNNNNIIKEVLNKWVL